MLFNGVFSYGLDRKVLACVIWGRLKSAFQIASRSESVSDVQYVAHVVSTWWILVTLIWTIHPSQGSPLASSWSIEIPSKSRALVGSSWTYEFPDESVLRQRVCFVMFFVQSLAPNQFVPCLSSFRFIGGCCHCRHSSQALLQCRICASSGWHHIEFWSICRYAYELSNPYQNLYFLSSKKQGYRSWLYHFQGDQVPTR
jgi:hypothetical protein